MSDAINDQNAPADINTGDKVSIQVGDRRYIAVTSIPGTASSGPP
jgi:hypothetical protein